MDLDLERTGSWPIVVVWVRVIPIRPSVDCQRYVPQCDLFESVARCAAAKEIGVLADARDVFVHVSSREVVHQLRIGQSVVVTEVVMSLRWKKAVWHGRHQHAALIRGAAGGFGRSAVGTVQGRFAATKVAGSVQLGTPSPAAQAHDSSPSCSWGSSTCGAAELSTASK